MTLTNHGKKWHVTYRIPADESGFRFRLETILLSPLNHDRFVASVEHLKRNHPMAYMEWLHESYPKYLKAALPLQKAFIEAGDRGILEEQNKVIAEQQRIQKRRFSIIRKEQRLAKQSLTGGFHVSEGGS